MLQTKSLLRQQYQLKQKLGQNAGRQTWQAEDITSGEDVIIKLLAFAPQTPWDDLKLFEREAMTLRQLQHPCIPQYRDYFSIDDHTIWFALVQSYIPGTSLKNLLAEGRKFSELEVKNIAINILEVLIYLHELSPVVLHRDIKPSNIILGEDQKIYLVDFGSVQACAATEGVTFTVVGSYGYTPMEQFGGRAVPASDLYALGATLIHLLTGITPAELPQQNMRIQFRKYLSISQELLDWIEILTHPHVEQRFPTARQALAALEIPHLVRQKLFKIEKPAQSRIKFKKSSHQLSIKIPSRGFKSSDSFILIWILVFYGATIPFGLITFPFVILYWLLGLIPLIIILFSAFGQIDLFFDQRHFILQWKLLGIPYRLLKGDIALIQDISEHRSTIQQINGISSKNIEIKAGNRKYQLCGFIAPICAVERQWLIQELRNWLGLISET
jgi:serine/threonine protein kinase